MAKTPRKSTRATANKRAAAAVAKTVRTTKPKASTHKADTECGCLSGPTFKGEGGSDVLQSCGQMVARRFAPGHDAKLKGTLIRAAVAGERLTFRRPGTDDVIENQDPLLMAEAHGWDSHVRTACDRAVTLNQAKATRAARIDAERKAAKAAKAAQPKPSKAPKPEAKAEPVVHEGFHPVRVKIGRSVVDANLEAEDGDQVTVSYQQRKGGALIPTTRTVARSALVA